MTLSDALAAIERLRPGVLSSADAISEISGLDKTVYKYLYKPRSKKHTGAFAGYDGNTPGSTALLLPDEFSDIYIHKLEAQADYISGEIERYNCGALLFNSRFDEFVKHYSASHRHRNKLDWRF